MITFSSSIWIELFCSTSLLKDTITEMTSWVYIFIKTILGTFTRLIVESEEVLLMNSSHLFDLNSGKLVVGRVSAAVIKSQSSIIKPCFHSLLDVVLCKYIVNFFQSFTVCLIALRQKRARQIGREQNVPQVNRTRQRGC